MSNNHESNVKEIRNIIIKFIMDNFVLNDTRETLDINISLYENRIIDSTGVLEIVDFLEEKFGIQIQDNELVPDNLDSILKISNFVKRKMNNAS